MRALNPLKTGWVMLVNSQLLVSTKRFRFKREMQEIVYEAPGDPEPDVRIEPVIKVVLILDGTERCHVGFLPRHVAARPREAARLHNKFAQIIELYDDTPEGYMRHNKSKRNHGMASYVLLDNIPEFE